jgi:hypothetical protein
LFGSFQAGAEAGSTTSEVWQDLRVNAATWQEATSGTPGASSIQELEEAGRQILSNAGVGIQDVNTYRSIAGDWLSAKQQLQAAALDQQIEAPMVFVPPWATTTGGEQDSQYRVKVAWTIPDEGVGAHLQWGTYLIGAPLTSVGDLLDQALAMVGTAKGSQSFGSVISGSPDDYQIEQV